METRRAIQFANSGDVMLRCVISGAQTGVDQAALSAAEAAGLGVGGHMPKGCMTETGPRPDLKQRYDMVEMPSSEYPPRTRANVQAADVTIWLGPVGDDGFGFGCTQKAAKELRKPFIHVEKGRPIDTPQMLADEIRSKHYMVVNVAGSRESKSPGIGARTEKFLGVVFRLLEEVQP